ncbi:MAG: hypothetical protein AAFO07_01555 [Bacteroidota bacterium]
MKKSYKVYDISCAKCSAYLLTYHKHGAGKAILRLYFHRIAAPVELIQLIKGCEDSPKEMPHLRCPNCEEVLGVVSLEKGKKWAYKMRQGYFHRKLRK